LKSLAKRIFALGEHSSGLFTINCRCKEQALHVFYLHVYVMSFTCTFLYVVCAESVNILKMKGDGIFFIYLKIRIVCPVPKI